MNPLKTPIKSIVWLWLCYAGAMFAFFFLPMREWFPFLPAPHPEGPGKDGAAIITALLLSVFSYGIWKHREVPNPIKRGRKHDD